jgi:hypothetical protein
MVFRTWDLKFGAWIFTLAVSKIETSKLLGRDFQDVGSQFWDLDFTQGASHDPGPGIFLAHDFQDMDGEPGDFTVSEGHGHPLVFNNSCTIGLNFKCHLIATSLPPHREPRAQKGAQPFGRFHCDKQTINPKWGVPYRIVFD